MLPSSASIFTITRQSARLASGSFRAFQSLAKSVALHVEAQHTLQKRAFNSTRLIAKGFKQERGTGDSGQSSLFNNERRWKNDDAFEALGVTDELSSYLGVCSTAAKSDELDDLVETLTRLQCCLQDLASHIATPPSATQRKKSLTKFDVSMVEWINAEIDRYGDELPPLKQFILSGSGFTSAHLQYARAVTRRVERRIVPLIQQEVIDPSALRFVNRMSDLLFVMGRYACMRTGQEELTYLRPASFTQIKWQKKKLSRGDSSNFE